MALSIFLFLEFWGYLKYATHSLLTYKGEMRGESAVSFFFMYAQHHFCLNLILLSLSLFMKYPCVCSVTQLCPTAALWPVAHWLLCPWNFPGKNTGVGCQFLLQGIS